MALKVSSLIQDVKIGEEVAYVTLGDHVWFSRTTRRRAYPMLLLSCGSRKTRWLILLTTRSPGPGCLQS